MAKELARQDRNGTRTSEELRRRYRFDEIELTKEELEYLKQFLVIDEALSITSTNAVQNKVVTHALNNKVNKETGKGLSSNDFTDDLKTKLDIVDENIIESISVNGELQQVVNKNVNLEISAVIEVDEELSTSSINPVQNKTVTQALENKEILENKVTSLTSSSTDEQYPSAKAVYDVIQTIEVATGVIEGGTIGQVLAKKSDNDYDTEWIDLRENTKDITTGQEYATNEYIDGKRVYEKIIKTTTTINGGTKLNIAHGIVGADRIWIDSGNSYMRATSNTHCYPLPMVYYEQSSSNTFVQILVDSTNLTFLANGNWGTIWEKVVRLKYTKN